MNDIAETHNWLKWSEHITVGSLLLMVHLKSLHLRFGEHCRGGNGKIERLQGPKCLLLDSIF